MFSNSALKARIVELEAALEDCRIRNLNYYYEREDLRKTIALLESKVDSFRKQREAIKVKRMVVIKFKRMVCIKFKALFDGKYQPTEFKIGLGKCGKVVHYFEVTKRDDRTLTIHQYHTDGSSKDFEYRLSDIDGRIQYDYELMEVYGEEAE